MQTDGPQQHQAAAGIAGNGFMRFFNAYPNPLTRFAAPGAVGKSGVPILRSLSGSTVASAQMKDAPEGSGSGLEQLAGLSSTSGGAGPSGARSQSSRRCSYPLSTVVIIALIAFLVGSLLRSMLSPADFVYVVSDLKDVSEDMSAGWREIRRLLEVKYIIGGWDFQVALVRRH